MSEVHVVYKKHFVRGTLKGLTITEHLPFATEESAYRWIQGCKLNIASGKLPWEFVYNGSRGEPAITVCIGEWDEQFVRDFETFCKWESEIK